MKSLVSTLIISVVLFSAVACTSTKAAVERKEMVTKTIESGNYTIRFNFANPARWHQIPLTSEYTLTLKKDSAIAFLPYFGVATTAPYGATDGGIQFGKNAEDFKQTTNKRNDGWDISFKVNTENYHYQLYLRIFDNGRASLNVNSTERDPISFDGELK